MPESQATLHAKLNGETGKLPWRELEPHFARGVVVKVAPDLDLVAVAAAVAQDDTHRLGAWCEQGAVSRASDCDAMAWSLQSERLFWAVVVFPWVLIQEVGAAGERA